MNIFKAWKEFLQYRQDKGIKPKYNIGQEVQYKSFNKIKIEHGKIRDIAKIVDTKETDKDYIGKYMYFLDYDEWMYDGWIHEEELSPHKERS